MKKIIREYLNRWEFREAFDFASRQPNTIAIRESFVLIASEASQNSKFSPGDKESLLRGVVELLIARKDFQRARKVLLLVKDLNWVASQERLMESVTDHGPASFDGFQAPETVY